MTQVFDPESGEVTAVTVIEAGPCPVGPDQDERDRRLRGRPARVRRRSPSASSRRASSAISRRRAPTPHRHLVEFRGQSELQVGEAVTVEAFTPGDKVKVAGICIGKGFQGTIKRHNFHARPGLARLAQRAQAGLDRRVGDTVARASRARRWPAGWAACASPSRASSIHEIDPSATCCSSRAPFLGPKSGIVEIRGR